MSLPLVLPIAGLHVLATGTAGGMLGAFIDGPSGAWSGALAGIVVAIVVETIRTFVVLKKQRVDNVVLIDTRRSELEKEAQSLHARESAFMERQLMRSQEMELINRRRFHAAINEVQRCALHIALTEDRFKKGEALEPFVPRSLEEIVELYPLPLEQHEDNPISPQSY